MKNPYLKPVSYTHLIKENYKEKERIEVELDFQKALTKMLFILVPLIIITVILCFANWLPLYRCV